MFIFGERMLPNKKMIERQIVASYFSERGVLLGSALDKFLAFVYSIKRSKLNVSGGQKYKRILILESHLIGDVVMGLPAYRAIREKYYDSEIIFWGNEWGKKLLSDQNIFDKFFVNRIPWSVYDYSLFNLRQLFSQLRRLRKLNIDIALDFRGDIRNIFLLYKTGAHRRVSYNFTGGKYWLTDIVPYPKNYHIIDRDLKVASFIGAESKQAIPKLNVPEIKIGKARRYLDKMGMKKIAFLHPGASQPKRVWCPDRFAAVVNHLNIKGYTPVLLSAPSDDTVAETIVSLCKSTPHILRTGLENIPAYLSCGELFIGMDSGIAHIAAAVGINVIMLFGPQLPAVSSARGEGIIKIIIKGDFECRPCPKTICDRGNACMKAVQVGDVIEAVDEIEKVQCGNFPENYGCFHHNSLFE